LAPPKSQPMTAVIYVLLSCFPHLSTSWRGLSHPRGKKDVDALHKAGHDGVVRIQGKQAT
jgi:hypothetical protein